MKFSFKPTALVVLMAGALCAPVAVFADAGGIFDDAPAKSMPKAAVKTAAPSKTKAAAVSANSAKADPDARLKGDISALNARIAQLEAGLGSSPKMILPGSIQVQRGAPYTDRLLDDGRPVGEEVNLLEMKAHRHVIDPTIYVGANLRAKAYYGHDSDGPDPDHRNSLYSSGIALDRTAVGFLGTLNDSMTAFVLANGSTIENAYILWGDLNHSPYYLLVGKNDVNFGNFRRMTPSTDPLIKTWFNPGQKNLVSLGYIDNGLELAASFFNGDSKPDYVSDTSTRSIRSYAYSISNYALSAAYRFNIMDAADVKVGMSLLNSSGFAKDNGGVNPAVDFYADLLMGRLLIHSEYVRTAHSSASLIKQPALGGTLTTVVDPVETPAARGIVNAWNIGASYVFPVQQYDTKASLSFGQFQPNKTSHTDQVVLGYTVKVAQGLETGIEYSTERLYGAAGTEIYTSNQVAAVFSAYF